MLASRSIKVTTHLATDTSAPTYMNNASARSRKDGLANSETASPAPDECDWVGAGKREVTIRSNRTTVKAASDQKISSSPPCLWSAWTTSGRQARPRPKQMSRRFNTEFRHVAATSATRACPEATIAFAPKPNTREQPKIKISAEVACTLVTINANPIMEPITQTEPTSSATLVPIRSMIGPLTAYARRSEEHTSELQSH